MKSPDKRSMATATKAVSDEKLIRVMRQSDNLRNRRRLRRAITSTGKPRAPEWTLQEQALLGKMPDAEAAKRLGRTIVAIRVRRQRLNIPNYGQPFRRWTPVRHWLHTIRADRGSLLLRQALGMPALTKTTSDNWSNHVLVPLIMLSDAVEPDWA